MASSKRSVLITGCSDGGLGAALAVAFHNAGLHVYATARNTSKMKQLEALGIETLELDVLSDTSIAACVSKLSALDILVNNAGAGYSMLVSDTSIAEAKKLFDLNVWAGLAVSQAFLPLLIKSPRAMIVNHTSGASVIAMPFHGAYSASKAAMAMFSGCLRLELEAFNIKVIDLKSGSVNSNLTRNKVETSLAEGSIYEAAREVIEKTLRKEKDVKRATPPHEWAMQVVNDLLTDTPPSLIWRGAGAFLCRLAAILPIGYFDARIKKRTSMDVIEQIIRERQG